MKRGIVMGKHFMNLLINFIVRAVAGMVLIYFINQFLVSKGIMTNVGINPITMATSGTLGVPGVVLLYGITFSQRL